MNGLYLLPFALKGNDAFIYDRQFQLLVSPQSRRMVFLFVEAFLFICLLNRSEVTPSSSSFSGHKYGSILILAVYVIVWIFTS